MNLSLLFDRCLRAKLTYTETMRVCREAEEQLSASGRFVVEAPGGWIFGRMTHHGVVIGNGRVA